MSNQNPRYDITPRIVPAGQESLIKISDLSGEFGFPEGASYQVAIFPAEGYANQTTRMEIPRQSVSPQAGILEVSSPFETEQEYVLLLEQREGEETRLLAELRLYALEPDLYSLRPFKGDIHMHTTYSDGREAPAVVTASCRKIGLDFMAITDHRKYAPSLEAIEAFSRIEHDLRIYPGEEVHAPDNPVHIVHFGGSFSVNELFKEDSYLAEVRKLQETLEDMPDGVDTYTYASCVWCYRKIREAGGLGLFCHPYWFAGHRYDVPGRLTDLIFEKQPYDALELIGGYYRFEAESNTLQVARYHEERAKGKRIPIVGVSDAHGSVNADLFGWYYTIVFAPSSDFKDLVQGIMDLRSVAVEAIANETYRAYGPFRLVRYAHFLLREVFPMHDELCAQEGNLMLAYVEGDESAADQLVALKGQTAAYYNHVWGCA